MQLVFLIFILTLFSMVLGKSTEKKTNLLSISDNTRGQKWYLAVFCILFIVLFGCRMGFVDTGTYKLMVKRIGTDFSNIFDEKKAVVEIGFNILMILSNNICTDPQFFIFLSTAITFIGVFFWVYRKSTDKALSIFLFITFFSFTFINAIRQAIVTVIFTLLYDKWKDKYWWLIIVCLILSLFHNSALLLIPICICARGKLFNWKVIIFYIFAILCVLAPGSIDGILQAVLSDKYLGMMQVVDKSTSIIRVIICAIPVTVALIYAYIQNQKGEKLQQEEVNIINIFLLDFAIMICALRTSYFARLSIYFSLFIVAYFPYFLKKIFTKDSRFLLTTLVVCFYSVFYLYQAYTYNVYGYLKNFYLYFM